MSGKGDGRRPTDNKAFEANHDALDWNNDKAPPPPQKKWVCVLNDETMQWEWVVEAPSDE